jgi:peptidoglycan/LPS O-acetylase OafA/YrhL
MTTRFEGGLADAPQAIQVQSSASPGTASARWPALDGMRGLMTVGVFLAHISYNWLPGAILFMDSFFMMSSFFITRLLMKDWLRNGRLDFKAFYVRRFKRLYPAMVAMVVVVVLFVALYLGHGTDRMLNVAGTLLYFGNWLRALQVPHEIYLGHTWSLSIEEQYYIAWPAVFALGLAFAGSRRKHDAIDKPPAPQINLDFWIPVLSLVAFACVAWRFSLARSGAPWERLYNGTDMRLDSLALGALLALTFDAAAVQRACTFLARPWLVWLMVATMLAGALNVDVRTMNWYAWQQPLFVLLSLALIMSILKTPSGWGLRFLFQNPVSLYLGAICYGLYLWHYPLIWGAYTVFNLGVWQCLAITAPMSLALASLSYHFIELPALKGVRGTAR